MTQNNKKSKSICIGITGGIASGKTTVAKIIEKQGFPVIYTDDLAKELMIKDEKVKKRIIRKFGDNVYHADGTLKNDFLASLVFGSDEQSRKNLQKLNVIVHPAVIDSMTKLVEQYEAEGHPLIFVESALIYELGLDEGFDYIICVYSDEDVVLKRAAERGLTPEQVSRRLAEQISPKQKLSWTDFSITNNAGMKELEQSTLSLLNILKTL